MCRSIKRLRDPQGAETTEQEIHEAALQFVRKISGYRVPSKANTEAFDRAVAMVAQASRDLLSELVSGRTAV